MVRRAASQLRPDRIALLLSLQDHEGACLSLNDGRAIYCYRGDALPMMQLCLALVPPVHVTPWRFAGCVMLYGVVLVIVALLGARDRLRGATGPR